MKLNKYIYLLGLATMALTTACEEQSEVVYDVEYDRLFSPIELEARIVNSIDVRLTWAPVEGATSYDIAIYQNADQTAEPSENDSDILSFDGSPVKSVTGITNDQIPYVVTGLDGETLYTASILAHGEGIADSKGSGIEFKTNAEQIFKAVNPDDVTATQVTLRWPAGQDAAKIVLTPGNIEYAVTADDIANGAATITGLTPETAYTAKLIRANGKTRGETSFETLIDLGGAIAVYPTDDLAAVIEGAEAGAALALFPGTYQAAVEEGVVGKFVITKDVELKAVRPNDRPIINACFQIKDGAAISLKQIVLDGTGTDGSQAFDYKSEGEHGALIIDDCEIKNYVKGVYYVNVAATVEAITINNTLIHDIVCDGGDMFDCRKGYIKAINLTNSTIWNSCKERDFVRFDDASGNFPGAAPVITIDHCTIDGICGGNRRVFYVRFKGNSITFTNNMVSNMSNCKRGFSDSGNTATPTFGNNNYFNTINLTEQGESDKTLKIFDTEGMKLDPGYKDAANGDFTLSHEDLIYKQVGDPRWY